MKTLSIVIPAYNEAAYIQPLLRKIIAVQTELIDFRKEIIVVDDGSTDGTAQLASCFEGVKVIRQHNAGKGAAVQAGVAQATGEYILIQDADLEYDPSDYMLMLRALNDRENVAVYGSRPREVIRKFGWNWPFPGRHENQGLGPWIANAILSLVTFGLYGRWITDTLTAYKLYPTRILRSFRVRTRGFETDHELSAKLIRSGIEIVEVPIAYQPRSTKEGKKIRGRDGLIAVWTLLRFRFVD
jgi:glycosyltransferase involved in cell wall biosynthesis